MTFVELYVWKCCAVDYCIVFAPSKANVMDWNSEVSKIVSVINRLFKTRITRKKFGSVSSSPGCCLLL